MKNLFVLLFLCSIIFTILGLIKPSFVRLKSRWHVGLIFLGLFIISIIGVDMLTPQDVKVAKQIQRQEEQQRKEAQKQEKKAQKLAEEQRKADELAAKQAAELAEKQAKEMEPIIIKEIESKAIVIVDIDWATMDSMDNNNVGIFFINNSDYRIIKGKITIRFKDAAGNIVDSDTLLFTSPIDPHARCAGILWLKTKRVVGFESEINIYSYEKP